MKTTSTVILGAFLAVLLSLGTADVTNAQQQVVKSDTIKFRTSDSATFYLKEFGHVNRGEKLCHTIFLQNMTGGTIVINGLGSQLYSGKEFSFHQIPTIPAVILNGELISIADLCYAPTLSTIDTIGVVNLLIVYSAGSSKGEIHASTYGSTSTDTALLKSCVSNSIDADVFGPIIMDGDVSHTATISSNRYDTLQVRMDTAIYGDNAVFHVSGITFPYLLAPREVKTFTITYSPRSNDPVVKYRSVGLLSLQVFTPTIDSFGNNQYWNYCDFPKFTLPGVAIPPTADSIATSLAAGSTDVLAMISDNSVTTKTFHFTNTGTTNLKITAVSLLNGKSFAITDIQPTSTLPFTLTPGQSMSVTIAMTTVSNGVYYDEVIITAEQALISMNFQLQGLRKNVPLGVNNTSATASHATLYPNPTTGSIMITMPGIRNAKIEILDILGNVITTTTASETWNYNCTEPAGTYFVHIIGTETSGKAFQSYDRFIIQK